MSNDAKVAEFVVKAIVEIILDSHSYSLTDNVFAAYDGPSSAPRKLACASATLQSVNRFLQHKTTLDTIIDETEGATLPPHFIYNIIAYLTKHIDDISNLHSEAVASKVYANTPNAEFNPEEIRAFFSKLLVEYPEYETRYYKGEKLIVMQMHTPNSINTIQLEMMKYGNMRTLDTNNLELALYHAARFLDEENTDFTIDKSGYDTVYPITSMFGSRMKIFYSTAYGKGFIATNIAEMKDKTEGSNAMISASELRGNVTMQKMPDVDLIALKRLVLLTDNRFIGASKALASISVVYYFLTEELRENGIHIEDEFESSAKKGLYKEYAEIIKATLGYISKAESLDDLMNSWAEWDKYYSSRLKIRANTNAQAVSLIEFQSREESITAYSTLVMCCMRFNEIRNVLNSYGYRLIDMDIPPDMNAMGDTLQSHLTDLYGEKIDWSLNDDELEDFAAMYSNERIASMLLEQYKDSIRDILKINISSITTLKLSSVYMPVSTQSIEAPEVSVVPKNTGLDPIRTLKHSQLMKKLETLFTTNTVAKDYRSMRNGMLYAGNYTIPESLTQKTLEIAATADGVPKVAPALLRLAIPKHGASVIKAFDAHITELFQELSSGFGISLPDACLTTESDSILNKLLTLQNFYFASKKASTAKLTFTANRNVPEQSLSYLIASHVHGNADEYSFRAPSNCDSTQVELLKQHLYDNAVPHSITLSALERDKKMTYSLLQNHIANNIGYNKNIQNAKSFVLSVYAELRQQEFPRFYADPALATKDILKFPRLQQLLFRADALKPAIDQFGLYTINGVPLFIAEHEHPTTKCPTIEFIHSKGGNYLWNVPTNDSELMANLMSLQKKLFSR